MTAQNLLTLITRGVAVGALLVGPTLSAQAGLGTPGQNRVPGPNAMYVMVPIFKSTDLKLRTEAANQMRSRIDQDFSLKELWPIPTASIDAQLQASGFLTTEPLAPHDASALAKILRANEYFDATATKTATGYKLDVNMVLSRDNHLVQPLGSFEAPKLGSATQLVSAAYKEARKQLDGEQKCVNAARDGKYAEAAQFARTAIGLYPKATLARTCLINVFDKSNAGSDSILKLAREILAVDPRSNSALRLSAKAYQATNQQDSAALSLVRLLATDPTNSRLQVEVVYEISKLGNMKIARPIIDTAVMQNPGDPDLLKLRWLILFAVRDFKEMYVQGEELTKLDTSFADTTFFYRTALAYATDSQPKKAADVAGRGVAKFPDHPALIGLEIQALKQAGDFDNVLKKLDAAEGRKIPVENAGQLRISSLQALNRNDEVIPVIRDMVTKGDTTAALRLYVIKQGNDERTKGFTAKDTAMLAKSLQTLMYADSISKGAEKVQAQFQLGATNVYLAQTKLPLAQQAKSCQIFKEMKNHLVDAQIQLPAGGRFSTDIMKQLMGAAMQMDPFVDQELKRLSCK